MKLSPEEAGLFYRLMWGLQLYVNEQLRIMSAVKSVHDYAVLSSSDKMKVRDALWNNPGLIDTYVRDNPHGLPPHELDIVRKWRGFISGTFQIFRQLKNHAIFIGPGSKVYAVLGLNQSLEEVFQGRPFPIMVETVLLPFKGKIIYDGLCHTYQIYFGGGIRAGLKEEYMTAKQQGRIITTLEPEMAEPVLQARPKPERDWRPEVDDVVTATQRMEGGPAVQSAAFTLLRASAKLSQNVVHNPDDVDGHRQLERQVRRALTRLQTALERAER